MQYSYHLFKIRPSSDICITLNTWSAPGPGLNDVPVSFCLTLVLREESTVPIHQPGNPGPLLAQWLRQGSNTGLHDP
jgi:hypothetical protein